MPITGECPVIGPALRRPKRQIAASVGLRRATQILSCAAPEADPLKARTESGCDIPDPRNI
jgi:hypothetical protein